MSTTKLLFTFWVMVCMFINTPMTFAQPSNDNPCNAVDLGVFSSCSYSNYTTSLATSSTGVTAPGCGNYSGGDVWFQITMPNNGYHVTIDMLAGTLTDAAMAVYSGSDCNNLNLVSCDDNSGAGNMPTLIVDDGCNFADAFSTFWIRVWDEGNDASGTFDICAYAQTPVVPAAVTGCGANPITGNTCCDALLLTDELNGYCGNTGGYTDEPNEIVGFCAFIENNSWIAFVASETDVELTLTSFNCLMNMGIQAQVMSTTDCTNFSFVSNCWNPGGEATGTLTANGLTPGETYYLMVDGWNGDVCDYTISVISGVETTSVTADDSELCNGETTQVYANVYGVGPFTYNWSPAASLSDATIWNPIASPSTNTEYIVTVTTPTENIIDTIMVTVYTAAPSGSSVDGPTSVCENSNGNIYTCLSPNANSYTWTVTGGATIDGVADGSTLIVDWGATGGTVCVTPANECGPDAQVCTNVTVSAEPNISATAPPVGCAPIGVNLSTVTINNSSGGIGIISFHANASDANAGTPALLSPIVTSSGTYWIRYQTAVDCYDIASVVVTIQDPEIVVVDPQATCSPNTIDLDIDVWKNEVNGYPGGTYSYYADTLDAVNEINVLSSTVVTTTNTYWVRYETTAGCFDVEPINIVIDVAPDLSTVGELFICPSDSVDISSANVVDANNATVTGVYYFESESFAVSGFTVLAMQNTWVQTAATYYVRYETLAGCWDTAHIVVNAAVVPDAVISGGGALCPGTNGDLTFTLTGNGPFDIEYTDGTNSFVANDVTTSPHIESVVVNINTTFTITNITDQSGCSGTMSGSASFTINSAPSLTMTGTAEVCGATALPLNFNLNGTGPFTVVYSDGTNNFTLNNILNGHVETVTPNSTTTYTLISVTDANGCTGAIFGGATITVNPDIQITNITETCDATNFNYTVSFQLSGGDPSTYNVIGAGNLNTVTNIFTSTTIASGSVYSFEVSDANCGPYMVDGAYACGCISYSGTMDGALGTKHVCESASVTMNFNNDETLDGDDVLGFVLHEGAGNALVNPLLFNTIPQFSYDPFLLTFGVTYYVSSVVANDDGSGFPIIDSSIDPCLSVSEGQEVIFYEETEASLSAPLFVCEGESVDITFNFTAPGTFNAEYTDGTSNFNLSGISDGHTISVSPTSQVTYTLIQVSNTGLPFCTGFVDAATASVTIDIANPPSVANQAQNCDSQNQFYTVSFDIMGGNASAGYMVTGDPGTLTGNSFVSDPILTGNTYNFEVSDNTCGPDVIINGVYLCDCTTAVGVMPTGLTHICESASVTAAYDNTLEVLDGDDAMGYILHTSSGTTLGDVLMTSTTPTFLFAPPLVYGEEYYISAVVGNDDGSGFPVLDHTLDVCLKVAPGQPVIFYQETEVSISGPTSLCAGETANVVFNFTGPDNYNVEYTDGTSTFTLVGISDGYILNVTPAASVTFEVVQVTNMDLPFCVGYVTPGNGTVAIDVFETPEISNFSFVCDDLSINYTVTFEISGGNAANYVVTGGAGILTGNIFTSEAIPGGTSYVFQISDGGPCPIMVEGTQVCNCSPDMQPLLMIEESVSCPGESDAVLSVSGFSGEPPYSYIWSTGLATDIVSGLNAGWYYVTMTDANSCTSQDSIFIDEPTPISAELEVVSPTCYGEAEGVVTIVNVTGGSGNYTYSLEGATVFQNNLFVSLEAGTYQATVMDDNGCEWTGEASVIQPEEFMVSITNGEASIQLGDSIELELNTNMPLDSIYWSPDEVVSCVNCESQVIYPMTSVNYSLTAINEDGCVSTDQIMVFVQNEHPIYVPNAFSPNGDGVNDFMSVYPGRGVENIREFKIFTRWGELLYSQEDFMPDYDNEGWDGSFKGEPMSQGVYIYFLEVEYIDGTSEVIKGDLTIIK